MRKASLIVIFMLGVGLAAPGRTQAPGEPQAPGAPGKDSTVVESAPGKAKISKTVDLSARIVAIDKADRVITLKGRKGDTVDVVAGDEVKNFDQIKLGDTVSVRYTESLYLELKKRTKQGAIRQGTESIKAERAPQGERPSASAVREIVILADVVKVDPKDQSVTLKGPKGNFLTLPVRNPETFNMVKKGDQVEATYTQAVAVAVTPTPVVK